MLEVILQMTVVEPKLARALAEGTHDGRLLFVEDDDADEIGPRLMSTSGNSNGERDIPGRAS